jgi:hypothetical protein
MKNILFFLAVLVVLTTHLSAFAGAAMDPSKTSERAPSSASTILSCSITTAFDRETKKTEKTDIKRSMLINELANSNVEVVSGNVSNVRFTVSSDSLTITANRLYVSGTVKFFETVVLDRVTGSYNEFRRLEGSDGVTYSNLVYSGTCERATKAF